MPILVIAGIAVAVLGAVVLLLFPDRPGGAIGWHGLKVDSKGAGLPLIALGVVSIAVGAVAEASGDGATQIDASPPGATVATTSAGVTVSAGSACARETFATVPANRRERVELGAPYDIVIRPGEPLDQPIGFLLEDAGRALGFVTLAPLGRGRFRVVAARDARCKPAVEVYDNDALTEDLGQYHDLRVEFADGAAYLLAIDASADVRAELLRAPPR